MNVGVDTTGHDEFAGDIQHLTDLCIRETAWLGERSDVFTTDRDIKPGNTIDGNDGTATQYKIIMLMAKPESESAYSFFEVFRRYCSKLIRAIENTSDCRAYRSANNLPTGS